MVKLFGPQSPTEIEGVFPGRRVAVGLGLPIEGIFDKHINPNKAANVLKNKKAMFQHLEHEGIPIPMPFDNLSDFMDNKGNLDWQAFEDIFMPPDFPDISFSSPKGRNLVGNRGEFLKFLAERERDLDYLVQSIMMEEFENKDFATVVPKLAKTNLYSTKGDVNVPHGIGACSRRLPESTIAMAFRAVESLELDFATVEFLHNPKTGEFIVMDVKLTTFETLDQVILNLGFDASKVPIVQKQGNKPKRR